MLYQWEQGQFIEFISLVRSEMMCSIYDIIHIWIAVVEESEQMIIAVNFQFMQLERRSLKKILQSHLAVLEFSAFSSFLPMYPTENQVDRMSPTFSKPVVTKPQFFDGRFTSLSKENNSDQF